MLYAIERANKMEKTYTIHDIITEAEIANIIDVAVRDGIDLAESEGIEFKIDYDTCNVNTVAVNDYKHRLSSDTLNLADQSIIEKYKAM